MYTVVMELEARLATEQDFPGLLAILNHALRYKQHREDRSWGGDDFNAAELRDYMRHADLYAVTQQDEVVGTFSLTWEDDEGKWAGQPALPAAYLHRLAVAEDRHGWKLGEKLVEQAAQLARQHSRQYLRLDCNADSARLCAYYENLGFERVGSEQLGQSYMAALYQRPL